MLPATAEHGEELDRVEERPAAGGDVGPADEGQHQQRGHRRYPPGQLAGPVPDVTGGLQGDEGGAVQHAQRYQRDARQDRVRLEQVPEVAGVLVVGADGQAVQQVAEHDADQQRRQEARDDQQAAPVLPPALRGLLPRYSNDTPRTMSAHSSKTMSR